MSRSTSAGPSRSSAATNWSRATLQAQRPGPAPTSTRGWGGGGGGGASGRSRGGPQIFLSAQPPAVHGQAVPDGSAGNLRRHRSRSSRSRGTGQPCQDRRAEPRQLDRPRRRLRRHAAAAASRRWSASCRARRSTSFRGRRTRRPSWSMPWRRPRSPRSCSTTSRTGSSGGPGRAALAGDRPARPERPPRLDADRLGYRHPDRGGGERAPPGGDRSARSQLFMGRAWTWTT